jgi:hypothetical protein
MSNFEDYWYDTAACHGQGGGGLARDRARMQQYL